MLLENLAELSSLQLSLTVTYGQHSYDSLNDTRHFFNPNFDRLEKNSDKSESNFIKVC